VGPYCTSSATCSVRWPRWSPGRDLHIWTLSSNRIALSAHLVVESLAHWPAVLAASRQVLSEQGIRHVTLQPEPLHNAVRWLAPGEQRGVPES